MGLLSHPALAREVLHTRHPLYAQVIYHADAWSLYSKSPPDLTFSGPAEDPIQPAPDGLHDAAPDEPQAPAHEMDDANVGRLDGGGGVAEAPLGGIGGDGPEAPNAEELPAPAQKTLQMVLADHHGIQELVSKHLLQHLRAKLAEQDAPTYCIVKLPGPVAEVAVKSLQSLMLQINQPVPQDL